MQTGQSQTDLRSWSHSKRHGLLAHCNPHLFGYNSIKEIHETHMINLGLVFAAIAILF